MNGLMVLLGLIGAAIVVYGLVRVAWRSVGVGALFAALGFGGNWLFMQYGTPVLWAFAIGGALALLWGLWNLLRTRRNALLPVAGLLAGLVGVGGLGFLPQSVANPVNAVSSGAAGAAQTVASGLGLNTAPNQTNQTEAATNGSMGSDPNGSTSSGTSSSTAATPDAQNSSAQTPAADSNATSTDPNATTTPDNSATVTPDASASTSGTAQTPEAAGGSASTDPGTSASNSAVTERPSPLLPPASSTTPNAATSSPATSGGLRELEAACPCVLNVRVNASAATVKLLQGNATVAAQSVDATGRTSLRVENAGAYSLVVEANGYNALNANIELPKQLNLDVALSKP